MSIYHVESRLFHFAILMLVTDGLLVAMRMIMLQGVSVNIKWKALDLHVSLETAQKPS